MSYQNYRYRHEKMYTEEPKPVKPQASPKGKSKPKAQLIVQEIEEEIVQEKPKLTQEVKQQVLKPQPSNPLNDITNHYQTLQQQYIQQKKEKYKKNYVKICFQVNLKKIIESIKYVKSNIRR